jgi:hypothetical protein
MPDPAPDFPPLTPDEVRPFLKLGNVLRFTGFLLLVIAGCLVVLALAGHDTPQKVNFGELLLGILIGLNAGGAVAAGRALRRAMAGGGDRESLVRAVVGILGLFVSVMLVVGLFAVGAVVAVVEFLARVANSGG